MIKTRFYLSVEYRRRYISAEIDQEMPYRLQVGEEVDLGDDDGNWLVEVLSIRYALKNARLEVFLGNPEPDLQQEQIGNQKPKLAEDAGLDDYEDTILALKALGWRITSPEYPA